MRTPVVAAPLLIVAALALACPAVAQTADRYGGVNHYAAPAAQQQPQRVLTWPGKTIPAPAAAPTAPSPYYNGRPTYGATLQPPPYQQAPGAPAAPYAQQRNATLYPPPGYPPQAYAPAAYPQPRQGAPQSPPQPQQPVYNYPPQGYAPQNYAPQAAQPQLPAQGVAPMGYQAYPPQPLAYYPVPAAGQTQPAPQQQQGYAPMGVFMPPPNTGQGGPMATAPSGVYPAQPGYPQPGYPVQGLPANAYPPAPFPQGPVPQQPFPAPQASATPGPPPVPTPSTGAGVPVPPNSIYAPTPQATGEAEAHRPQMLAMNTAPAPNAGAKLYSVHRPFGLEPDHPTVSPQFFGESIDLAEPPPPVERNRVTGSGTGTRTRAATLRSLQDDQDFGPDPN